jgi:Mg2+-importing ATPase
VPDIGLPSAQPASQVRDDFWNVRLADVLRELAASGDGLSSEEATARLKRVGPNNVTSVRDEPVWRQILRRFGNPLVLILLIASGLSAATGDVASFVIVVVIVLLSVALDFVQERRAQNTITALRKSVAARSDVVRDGGTTCLLSEMLVPGDVVRITAGDLVPADARLISGRDLYVNQALLTGEPYPVEKSPGDLAKPVGDIADAANAVFAGTSVISGNAAILVCRTGKTSMLGTLASSLVDRAPPTAFEIGLRRFGLLIVRLTVLLVLFVLTVNLSFHRPALESLMFALALAVGLTPELLPMIVTVTLARGAKRLAKRRAIVKHLSALHNIGAIDVLCTDKTGTLTEAKITLVRTIDASGADSERVFEFAYLNSYFETGLKNPMDEAILARHPPTMTGWVKIDEIPFDFERRRVSVEIEKDGVRRLIVKGAPEDVIGLSTHLSDGAHDAVLDDNRRRKLIETFEALGEQGYRALAIAYRKIPDDGTPCDGAMEHDLIFAGFAVFVDPPKASAGETVHRLAAAGVIVKILTGDNERIARHVCTELNIPVTGVMTGDQLRTLDDDALTARVMDTTLFCRVNPAQKHRIILALKRLRQTVGFMGDGINDATALHTADVGISVDSAADVTREAADIILLDHDLSVVHQAIVEGRASVVNASKYILMGSSSNFGNMFSMAGAALFLPFLPMLPIQVMLNNLLYDVSQVAVPFDHVDPELVQGPVHWDIRQIRRFITVIGPVSSIFDFATFYVLLKVFHASEAMFHSGWFIESLASQVLVVFSIRTRRRFFLSRAHPLLAGMATAIVAAGLLLVVTPAGRWLQFVMLPASFFGFLVAAIAFYLLLVEMTKRVFFSRIG